MMLPNITINKAAQSRDKGSALIVALVFLLVITLLSVAGIQNTSLQERMSGNFRDRDLAFQAAEYALRDGEGLLESAALPNFDGTTPGLIQPLERGFSESVWNSYAWGVDTAAAPTNAASFNVASNPRYVIEQFPPMPDPQGSLAADEPLGNIEMFRITSRATGGTSDAVVILQSTYRR